MKSFFQNLIFATTLVFLSGGLFSFSSNNTVTNTETETAGGAYLTFADKFGGTVTQKDLRNTKEIGVAGCAKGSWIYTFNLKITKNGKRVSFKGTSPTLTKEMLKELRSLSKGDEFVFKKVRAYLPDGKSEVDVWGKKFTVV